MGVRAVKKKLLYFSHGLSANGIETFLVNVLSRLDMNKYDVTVLIAIDEGVPSLHEDTVRSFGVKIINAGDMDGLKKKFTYIKNVKRELEAGSYDIVHSNMDLLNGITLFLAKRAGVKKRICHGHTTKTQYKANGLFGKVKVIIQKVYSGIMKRLIYFSSTDLLACSEESGSYFYGNRNSKIINNGIDIKKYSEIKPCSFSVRDEIKAADNEKIIVSVGRISQVKNPLFAVEIINELKKLRSDFKYIWVGTGGLEEEMKKKIAELGLENTVYLTGVRSDVPQILSCCEMFLMPSLFEGLPFSLVEAQAAGLKCVVSDAVTETADAGLVSFFPLDSTAKQWAEFISGQLELPGQKADGEKLKNFDISYTVKQLEEIYDN